MPQIYWLEALVTTMNVQLLITGIINEKMVIKKTIVLYLLLYVPTATISILLSNLNDKALFSWILFAAAFFISFLSVNKKHFKSCLFIFLFYGSVSGILQSTSIWILRAFYVNDVIKIIVLIMLNIFMLAICFLINKKLIFAKLSFVIRLIPAKMKAFLLSVLWISLFLNDFISALFLEYPSSPNLLTIEVLTAIVILIIGLLCPLLVANSISSAYFKSVSTDMEKQVESQIKHYDLMAKVNADIRRFKHDFENLKHGLNKLLAEKDTEGAIGFLNECEQPFLSNYISFETGNRTVDALLSEKQELAKKSNTQIVFAGIVPSYGISIVDICIIFGNALDNAIEACEKFSQNEKKTISIKAQYENRFLFLTFENPVYNDEPVDINNIKTSKEDEDNHGFGLESIKISAKSYSGDVRISKKNGVFTLEIDFDLNERAEVQTAISD